MGKEAVLLILAFIVCQKRSLFITAELGSTWIGIIMI